MNVFSFLSLFFLFVFIVSYGQNNTWTLVGPLGGNVVSVSVHPFSPDIIFASTENDGLYKTIDGGVNWDKVLNQAADVIFNPSNPSIIYYANFSGIFKSIDSGINWTQAASFPVLSLIENPHYNEGLLAGSHNGIVYLSTNGGNSWKQLNTGSTWDIRAIAISPADSNFILAGTSGDWNFPGDGIYQTTDRGETWQNSATSFLFSNIRSLVIDPQNPDILYAGTLGGGFYSAEGIIKSTDAGLSWSFINDSLPLHSNISDIAINPNEPNILYSAIIGPFGYFEGLYKSLNGGQSWFPVNTGIEAGRIRSLALFSGNPDILLASSGDYGLLRSNTGGEGLRVIGVKPVRMNSVYIDPNHTNTIYGMGRGIFKSTDDGQNWELVNQGIDGDCEALAIDPSNSNIIYASTTFSSDGALYKSTNGSVSWTKTSLQNVAVHDIAIDPNNSDIIYAGSLYKSEDGGLTWNMLMDRTVLSIDIHPLDSDTLFVGTRNEGIYRSIDGGSHWNAVNNGIPSPFPRIQDILIDRTNPAMIYFGAINAGIYKSVDGGDSWLNVSNGLTNLDIRRLAMDTVNHILYTGIWGAGIFKSINEGKSWVEMNQGWQTPGISGLAATSLPGINIVYASLFYDTGVWKYIRTPMAIESEKNNEVTDFTLFQNYPNPFNPITTIRYTISKPTYVILEIINLLGQKVRTLVNERKPAGTFYVQWDGKGEKEVMVSSGTYLYVLRTDSFVHTKKMIHLK